MSITPDFSQHFVPAPDSFRGIVARVIDGDTIVVCIDHGFHIYTTQTVRVLGVNCPERKGATKEAGDAAKVFTESLFPTGTAVLLDTQKDPIDKYGRFLATVLKADGHDMIDLSEALLKAGHAVAYFP